MDFAGFIGGGIRSLLLQATTLRSLLPLTPVLHYCPLSYFSHKRISRQDLRSRDRHDAPTLSHVSTASSISGNTADKCNTVAICTARHAMVSFKLPSPNTIAPSNLTRMLR
jgi:hypothetical protein